MHTPPQSAAAQSSIIRKLMSSNASIGTFELYALSFFTNAAILVFEITGGRLLAPYLGTTVGVWAGLIAIVLGGMAVGYHFGGYFGDSNASRSRIGMLLALASAAAFFAWGMRDLIPSSVASAHLPVTWGALIAGTILFMPTVILLAAVSPMLAKNLLTRLDESARVVGTVNAVGTAGSIAGAVMTGLVLIPSFGVSSILFSVAVSVALAALWTFRKRLIPLVGLFAVVVASSIGLNSIPTHAGAVLADISTSYNRILVTSEYSGREMRALSTNPFGAQCVMYIGNNGTPNETSLAAPYQKAEDVLVSSFFPNGPKRALFLGGCAATYPRYLMKKYPDIEGRVVEIDPATTETARKYFGFVDAAFPRLEFSYEDARIFVNRDHGHYDLIYLDTFDASGRVPFHLATEEMFSHLARLADDDALLIMNVIGTYVGDGALYPAVYVKTAQTAFHHVALYQYSNSPEKRQNLILAATNARQLPDEISSPQNWNLVLHRVETPSNVITMTDDYAPVEGLPAGMLMTRE